MSEETVKEMTLEEKIYSSEQFLTDLRADWVRANEAWQLARGKEQDTLLWLRECSDKLKTVEAELDSWKAQLITQEFEKERNKPDPMEESLSTFEKAVLDFYKKNIGQARHFRDDLGPYLYKVVEFDGWKDSGVKATLIKLRTRGLLKMSTLKRKGGYYVYGDENKPIVQASFPLPAPTTTPESPYDAACEKVVDRIIREKGMTSNVEALDMFRDQCKALGLAFKGQDDAIKQYLDKVSFPNAPTELHCLRRLEATGSDSMFWFQAPHLPTPAGMRVYECVRQPELPLFKRRVKLVPSEG